MFGLSDGTWLYGGAGNDFLMSMSTVEGARGHLYGGTGDDRIFASDAISFAYGGTGNDEVSILFNLGGEAAGGSGIDTLVLNLAVTGTLGAATDVSVTRGGADAGATAGAQHMAFRGFEILDITTNTGDDTVRAGNFDDRIDVWSGAKMVRANGGNDVVSYRTSDANYLNGGAGEDTLFVVEADPIVSFGFSVNGAHATDGAGSVLLNFEHYSVIGGLHNDVVLLGDLADEFRGLAGDDSGLGMAGADRLWGGGGNDTLYGGEGNDELYAGTGQDSLFGCVGADTFLFGRSDHTGAVIVDMTAGEDHIAIRSQVIGDRLPGGAVDAFYFHLDAAAGTSSQFVYRATAEAGVSELIWDSNGAACGGELLIALFLGDPVLTVADLTIY